MSKGLFEIDDEGWKSQQKGRNLWELVRELLQNALDNGSRVVVTIDTRNSKVTVRNYESGFDDLSNAYTIFRGDKGGDPTKRGRFGRGLKEAVGASQHVWVMSTGGTVEFDVENNERLEHDQSVSEGTKVVIQNEEWTKAELDEVKEYVFKLWPPEGQSVFVQIKGGRSQKSTRWEPERTFKHRLKTVIVEDGVMSQQFRNTAVHVRRTEGNEDGRIYEMGIPVSLNEDFPFYVDVQQKIPMAEQRNEPDSHWVKTFKAHLLNHTYDMLSKGELQASWVQEALGDYNVGSEAKEYFVEKVIQDGRKKGSVLPGDDANNDKVRNYGYEVVDISKLSKGARRAATAVLTSADDKAREMHNRNEEQIPASELNENQQDWLVFAREVERRLNEKFEMPEVTFEFWNVEPSFSGDCPAADTEGTTIRFNTYRREWNKANKRNVGTLVHELAHVVSEHGHGKDWYTNMQDMFAALLVGEGLPEF